MRKTNQDSLWIRCPICNSKTRTKVYEDTVLLNFPLFCPKCKIEYVSSDAYYSKAVLWAVEKGVAKGTSADKFSPDSTCTRGQIVTFLYRAEQK